MSSICLTCSSTIRYPNKGFITQCCASPICNGCLNRNPRLRDYNPCLRCGDLSTVEGTERIRRGRVVVEGQQRERENVFEIGDDDEDEDEEQTGLENGNQARTLDEGDGRVLTCDKHEKTMDGTDPDEELETVEVYHQIKRGDNLLSIARKYAADPHHLITLNSLPPSILSTQPHLLRTRTQLLISKRRIPKSAIPAPTTLFASELPEVQTDAERQEQEKREKERAIKRFQLLTKTVDPYVGAAYFGLSELDESDPLGDGGGEGIDGKKVVREESNRETRALDSFYEDENWERDVGGPSKTVRGAWKTVGDGSKLGIKV